MEDSATSGAERRGGRSLHALPSSLAIFQMKTAESWAGVGTCWDGVGSVQGEGDRKELPHSRADKESAGLTQKAS